jgi:HTH-type transcriptional regulator / antitoxin HipB
MTLTSSGYIGYLQLYGVIGGVMRVRSIADAAAAVRGRRLDRGLSQSELAQRSGISRKWISEFESGKATAEFALVIRIMEALGLSLGLSEDPSASATMTATGTVHPPTSDLMDLDAFLEEYRSG